MRRRDLLATALPLALAACGSRTTPPEERELLVVGPWEVMAGLDPSRTGYLFSRIEVAETLLDADDAGRPLPGLATRWTTSPDGLVWTFALRPGARFHDGSPVTPQAVANDLMRAKAQPGVFDFVPIAAIDPAPGSVAIRLRQPSSLLPAVLMHYSAQILAPASFDAQGRVMSVIGTGPYRVTDLSNQGFSVELSPTWTGRKPAIRRARYLSASRSETRTLMAESGEADLVFTLDPSSIARLRANPSVKLIDVPIHRTTLIKLNIGSPLFSDLRARRAVSLAIDRAGIATAVRREPDMAATQLFPPVMPGWHQPGLAPLRTDVPEARRLLAELGWRPGADGVLTRDGRRFALTLLSYSDRPEMPLIATMLQDQLRAVGIALSIDIENSSAIPAAHRNGTLMMGLAARAWGTIPDPTGTLMIDYSTTGGDWGAMGWSSPPMTAALQALARGVPPAETDRLRALVATTMQDALPVIPVMWYRQIEAVGRRVGGVTIDPLERSYRISRMRWLE